MSTRIAYLANRFPSPVEPYVADEIGELRRRGVFVLATSIRTAHEDEQAQADLGQDSIDLQSEVPRLFLKAAWLCFRRRRLIADLAKRIAFRGKESPLRRARALLHTWLGACYALALQDKGIQHIHVHHGYFGSWVAMIAARLLEIPFSITLHGSDLLLHGTYLDVKLQNCAFCRTVSQYNHRYILEHYPEVASEKVIVSRLGVEVPDRAKSLAGLPSGKQSKFTLLAVGRLHPVKDHAFLVRACFQLKKRGIDFECLIAGEGPERRRLESQIRRYKLEGKVTLLGHIPRAQMDSLYGRADVVVLTSRSEGIPLVLMEAMARGKLVLAPDITGIPELVIPGKSGFLYTPGVLEDFIRKLSAIHAWTQGHTSDCEPKLLSARNPLDWIRHGARVQVAHNYHRETNLQSFADFFLQRVSESTLDLSRSDFQHENPVLQQVQPPLQRHRSLHVRGDGTAAIEGA